MLEAFRKAYETLNSLSNRFECDAVQASQYGLDIDPPKVLERNYGLLFLLEDLFDPEVLLERV
jgi:hypothetical protein